MVINAFHLRYLLPICMLIIGVVIALVITHFENDEVVIVKSARGFNGMVVSAHPLASEVGLNILRAGGNAADAAVAVQFALAVVYPRAGNIGGGGFMVYRDSTGEISALDYREKAPMLATRDMFLDSTGQVIDRSSLDGMLAAGVPGTVAGLYETHRKFGRLPWHKLVEPSIYLAANGFKITELEAGRINNNRDAFIKFNISPMPFVKTESWKKGDLLKQKQLASFLRQIADEGADGFYQGENAIRIDSLSKAQHGVITAKDLHDYRAVWRQPMLNHWRGYDLYSMPLPSSGGIVLGQILTMIDSHLIDSLGYRNLHNVHVIVEAERRAYEDRATYLGDPDFYSVPVDSLLSTTYLHNRFSSFDIDQASVSLIPDLKTLPIGKEHLETTHISIADRDGNAASVTTTLNNNYGCKVWVPGAGYFLNDEMDDFSSKPGQPNMFGLVGSEANAIAPGKRMLSSMTPTIVEKNGKLYMVLGSPGGSSIIPTVLQVFLNVEAFSMKIEDAVAAPRYFHQWLPDEITFEKDGLSVSLQDSLVSMGYHMHPIEMIGLVEAIWVDPENNFHGAADPRADDHACGW